MLTTAEFRKQIKQLTLILATVLDEVLDALFGRFCRKEEPIARRFSQRGRLLDAGQLSIASAQPSRACVTGR